LDERGGALRREIENGPETTAEILFTSGATSAPKGVIITHRNILANIVPVEREVLKYIRYTKPFSPIRFLNLLPLSHMFGQAMALFIPPMINGTVVFQRSQEPREIVRQIKSRRICQTPGDGGAAGGREVLQALVAFPAGAPRVWV